MRRGESRQWLRESRLKSKCRAVIEAVLVELGGFSNGMKDFLIKVHCQK